MVRFHFSAALLLNALLLLPAYGQQAPADTPGDWRARFESGKQAYARHDYPEAVAQLAGAAELAAHTPGNEAAFLEILRFQAAVHRIQGNHAQAEEVLQKAAAEYAERDPVSLNLAAILEEISSVQRSQGRSEDSLATIGKAIQIREANPESPRIQMARDLTIAALMRSKAGNPDKPFELLERAVREWDLASPGDPQSIPAIEALATAHRDRAEYQEAEPLLLRALRLRESGSGPDSAEVISAVDSLAYVEFGLKKFAEAEVLYKRLADLWEKNAGDQHPMLALTFDKMAEFYAFQQRYEEAEKFARRSLDLRTRMHLASLNQTGRVILMEAKIDEGEKLYHAALQIADLAEAPDDAVDPVLRTYAVILRTLKRTDEADKLDARVKDALIRKGDREGRLPSPVTMPKK